MLLDHPVDKREDLFGTSSLAVFNPPRTHRYVLIRSWDKVRPVMTFVMLNPSTADAFIDDPTIRRCLSFARRDGCGSLNVVNLFALRATDPAALYEHADPVGSHNDQFITSYCANGATVVAAWGTHGALEGRGLFVAGYLTKAGVTLHCLGTTKDGEPKHPLYVAGSTPLTVYRDAA